MWISTADLKCLEPGRTGRRQLRNFLEIPRRREVTKIDVSISFGELAPLIQELDGGRRWLEVRHVDECGHATNRCGTRHSAEVLLVVVARDSSVNVEVDQARKYPATRRVDLASGRRLGIAINQPGHALAADEDIGLHWPGRGLKDSTSDPQVVHHEVSFA